MGEEELKEPASEDPGEAPAEEGRSESPAPPRRWLPLSLLTIGTIAGFDDTHMPNHMNIVIAQDRLQSGAELGLKLEEPVSVGAA